MRGRDTARRAKPRKCQCQDLLTLRSYHIGGSGPQLTIFHGLNSRRLMLSTSYYTECTISLPRVIFSIRRSIVVHRCYDATADTDYS